MKRPYVKLYVNDFFSSPKVRRMNTLQRGMLLLLLMEASQTKCICLPDDEAELALLIGMPEDDFKANYAVVKECFKVKNGNLHNEKLKLVLKDYDDTGKLNRRKALIGIEKRKKEKSAAAQPQHSQIEEKAEEEPKPEIKPEIKKELIKEEEKEMPPAVKPVPASYINSNNSISIKETLAKNQNAESVKATPVVAPAENGVAAPNNVAPAHAEQPAKAEAGAEAIRTRDALLDELNESESIIEMLCMQLGCNIYEAKCMRIMFTRHIIGTGAPVTNITHLRTYCVNWCRSHATVLLNTLNNRPQRRR